MITGHKDEGVDEQLTVILPGCIGRFVSCRVTRCSERAKYAGASSVHLGRMSKVNLGCSFAQSLLRLCQASRIGIEQSRARSVV